MSIAKAFLIVATVVLAGIGGTIAAAKAGDTSPSASTVSSEAVQSVDTATVTTSASHHRRGEAEPGDDRGREAEPGDDRGGDREAEPGDDRGGHGEAESGDDHGGDSNRGPGGGDDD